MNDALRVGRSIIKEGQIHLIVVHH